MMPVTSRAGVTSNAGLATGVVVAARSRTVARRCCGVEARHFAHLAGRALLDRDAAPAPSSIVQSIVGDGTAA